jgi:hypothetical protein
MKARALLATLLLAAAPAAMAERQTVCTITVNSADEREAFRRNLPEGKFDFVELVERGNPDWLATSCRKGVRCDVLLVSGHFAGTEFYASRADIGVETLPVDVLERAACSGTCPGLFEDLKEVYLFGCDTLNPSPVRVATPEVVRALLREGATPDAAAKTARELAERHGESAMDHMRRLFAGVPVIYGFSSKAPYGRYAGPVLERHLQLGGASEVGSGAVSERLRRLFAPASMVVASGQQPQDRNADYRAEACGYHDTRIAPAQKLGAIHAMLARSMAEARLSLDRMEKFVGELDPAQRGQPEFAAAMATLVSDAALRERYLDLARDTEDPAVRLRLLSLGRGLGWLTPSQERDEIVAMIGGLLASKSSGFHEVELVCSLNRDGGLDGRVAPRRDATGAAAHAALACLGHAESRSRALEALVSPHEPDVQVAASYLRHRPIAGPDELRSVAARVTRMNNPSAQARALEALARQHVTDEAVLEELAELHGRTRSPAVRNAIVEVYLRAGKPFSGTARGPSSTRAPARSG